MPASYIQLFEQTSTKTVLDTEVVWRDVKEAPFSLHGFCESDDDLYFRRVPSRVAEATSSSVAILAKETSGGRIRFSTDSPFIAISVKFRNVVRTHNLPLICAAGFDLYRDSEFGSQYIRTFCMKADMTDSYEQISVLDGKYMRSYTINFPIHAVVESFKLGFAPGSSLRSTQYPYKGIDPIVFYGSSIVHGIAASRPGCTYPAMVGRGLNVDFRNIGFSGAAKGEEAMARWIASLPMSVFVFDYDHNAPTPEHLEKTHHTFYQTVRAQRPEVPIIMISRPDFGSNIQGQKDTLIRRDIIMSSYLKAREAGDQRVYFIDGLSFNLVENGHELSVDSCHPSDAGFLRMAESVAALIKHILTLPKEENTPSEQ